MTIVTDASALPALAARLRQAPLLAFDTETSSLEPHDAELIGLSFATSPTEIWYLPFGHRPPARDLFGEHDPPAETSSANWTNLPAITSPACAAIANLLRDPAVPKAGHNIKYDGR